MANRMTAARLASMCKSDRREWYDDRTADDRDLLRSLYEAMPLDERHNGIAIEVEAEVDWWGKTKGQQKIEIAKKDIADNAPCLLKWRPKKN